jgi:phosphoserine phosphatase RsbU/P
MPGIKRKKQPLLQYVCLALLFALAASYQIRATLYSFPDYFHIRVAAYPFVPDYVKGQARLGFVIKTAQDAGVKENDVLLAVDGRPFTGFAVFGEAMRTSQPGDTLTVEIITPGNAAPRTATMRLGRFVSPRAVWAAISLLTLKLFMPAFCILLGFWVAFVRPRDPSAWFLCLIMLFFSVFYSPGVESWGPVVRDVARGYRVAISSTWPIFMLLFGVYFPEPFPGEESFWWKWSKRIVISALILFAILSVLVHVGQLENFAAVAFFYNLLDRLSALQFILSFAATGGFFACIAAKMGKAVTPDAKRRLKLLYTGSTISMAPACILFVAESIKGGQLEQIFPEWFVIFALLLMLLFPVTLAYVIVVHRAMDVRVVVRQGLQYALATNGIRVLQAILIFVTVGAAVSLASDPNRSRPQKITAMAWGVVIAI